MLRRFLYANGLSLVVISIFIGTLAGMTGVGFRQYNNEQREHGQRTVSFIGYLGTGEYWEAVGENWESEFLQMGAYVWFTAFLRQKGSSESRKLADEAGADDDETEHDPEKWRTAPNAPWPVRRGGWVLAIYSHSLSLAFLAMFAVSFAIHAAGGAREFSESEAAHGRPGVTIWQYLGTSQFWFESLQNWQSEFLAIAAMVLLSIWLRERGSPESKPVGAPHSQTGD